MVALATASLLIATGLQVAVPLPVLAAAAPAPKLAVSEAADPASAQAAAKSSGRRVEISSRRDADEQTFANADGTFTTETTAEPVRAQKADGSWAPIDTALVKDDKGVHPGLALGSVAFSSGGATAPLASLSDGSGSLQVSWPGMLPAPSLAGDTATYASVQPNTDLTVRATRRGYEDSVVLRTAPALSQQSFRFGLKTTGWVASANDDGMVTLTSAGGAKAAVMAPSRMFDAHRDPLSGEPDRFGPVTTQLVTAKDGSQQLVLTPDPKFLADPTTVYPVTIDPDVHLGEANDMWVANNSTGGSGSSELRVGYYNGNGAIHRSFVKFSQTPISAKHVISAILSLYQWYTPTGCTAKNSRIYSLAGSFDDSTTWSSQPAVSPTVYAQSNSVYGATGCASWWNTYDVTSLAAGWAGGTIANYGVLVRSGTESDTSAWWRFYGQTNSVDVPTLAVTYNSYPTVGVRSTVPSTPCVTGSGRPFENNTRPRLNSIFSDADGGTLKGSFEVWPQGGSSAFNSGLSLTWSPSGASNGWTMTSSLTNGSSYQWRERGWDGTDYGSAWSSWCEFTVDTTAPAAPVVSSSNYTSGGWAAVSGTTSNFSWTNGGSSDVVSYLYGLDSTVPSLPTTGTTLTFNPAVGWHTLSVRSIDHAGNLSPISTFTFGVGDGALTSPADQSETQQAVTVSSAAPSLRTYVRYQYRIGSTGTFADIPAADMVVPGTSTTATVPAPRDGSGNFPSYTWNLAHTVTNDGLVQVQACFLLTSTDTSPICSPISNVQLDALTGSGSSTASVGPGSLNLLTGDLSVSAGDVSVPTYRGSLSIGRSLTTLAPAAASSGANGIFGPSWTASLPGPDAGAADAVIDDHTSAGYVDLIDADGTASLYRATTTVSPCLNNFAGLGDAADGSVLCRVDSVTFKLTDADGTVTTWTLVGGAWQATSVAEPGSSATTSYTHDGNGLVTQILGPVPPGVTCTTPLTTVGCRTLNLTYATSTTATGGTGGTFGDYIGRLKSVSFTAADPTNANTMTPVAVASYAYDSTGFLRQAWDPRISPALKTAYSYDSNGRLATLTPPGLNAWTLVYDSTKHRLTAAQRQVQVNGVVSPEQTAQTTVVYDLPTSGTGLPDLTAGTTATWAQTGDPAYTGTAVFGPDHALSLDSTTHLPTVSSTDYPYASLTYLDANGRTVNTGSYGIGSSGTGGWLVDSTVYDQTGNTIWSLPAGLRDEALNTSGDQTHYAPSIAALADGAARAQLLATANSYTSDGLELTDTLGPVHPATLDATSDGTLTDVRTHDHTDYDQGAPGSGGPFRLPTTQTQSAQTLDGVDHDTQTSLTGYDPIITGDTSGWTLRQPTTTTTVMTGGVANIVHTTRYDATGGVIETRMPSDAAGGHAGSQLTTYYTAGSTGTCVNTGMAGLPCQTAPAAQPTSGPNLPTTTTTYNLFSAPVDVTEVAGTTTRTSHTGYDSAYRPSTQSTTITGTTDLHPIDIVTTGYSTTTGLPLATTATPSGATITAGYDTIGRQISYQDADGNTSTVNFTIDALVNSSNDGKNTTSYSYDDTTGEHRRLATGLSAGLSNSAPGTFSANYDATGALSSQTYPNSAVATVDHDETGAVVNKSYTLNSTPTYTYRQVMGSHGQIRHAQTPAAETDYSYDPAGRLTSVKDAITDPNTATVACTRRVYDFSGTRGEDSNRSSLTQYQPDSTCTTSTVDSATSSIRSYDEADRLTTTGYSYDNLGRTSTVPETDAGGTGAGTLNLEYFGDDLIAKQTQGATNTRTFTLDPNLRIRTQTTVDSSGTSTSLNHYSSGGDSPSWIATTAPGITTGWSRNITGLDGSLALIQTATTSGSTSYATQVQITNPHGDITATVDDATGASSALTYGESSEYGTVRSGSTLAGRYGWLGGKQRSQEALGGVILMGVRLYNSTSGRFLSVDPVAGGSSNDYDYAGQDPVNAFDLDGRMATTADGGGAGYTHIHNATGILQYYTTMKPKEAEIWAWHLNHPRQKINDPKLRKLFNEAKRKEYEFRKASERTQRAPKRAEMNRKGPGGGRKVAKSSDVYGCRCPEFEESGGGGFGGGFMGGGGGRPARPR